MRRAAVVLVLAWALAGCEGELPDWMKWPQPAGEPPVSLPTSEHPQTQPADANAAPTTTPAPTPVPPDRPARHVPPAPGPTGRPVMATVNGRPIYLDQLTELLIAGHGMTVARQLIANEIVQQEAERQKIAITDDEVQAEHENTLRSMFGGVDSPQQRERMLSELLDRNSVSRKQWRLTMHRNALLAKFAEKRLKITDEELRDEFSRQYDRRWEVRHIQTATLAAAQKVLRELASGAEFSALAAKYSTGISAGSGGTFPPFSAKSTGVPPVIREAAMTMKKIGEVSDPIQVGTAFHVIKLVRIIEPKDVKFEDVKDKLLVIVRRQKMRAMQQEILQNLIRRAEVKYAHPTLKAQAAEGNQP